MKATPPTAGLPPLPVVGALWKYIGRLDPGANRFKPCARALHEMDPDKPPYPETWQLTDKLVKLSDALAAIACQGDAWQPIETAPKDGTQVLLYAGPQEHEGLPVGERITQGYWSMPSVIPRLRYQDGYAPEEEFDEWEPYWVSSDGGFTEENPPTQWQPLPAPPAITAKDAK